MEVSSLGLPSSLTLLFVIFIVLQSLVSSSEDILEEELSISLGNVYSGFFLIFNKLKVAPPGTQIALLGMILLFIAELVPCFLHSLSEFEGVPSLTLQAKTFFSNNVKIYLSSSYLYGKIPSFFFQQIYFNRTI